MTRVRVESLLALQTMAAVNGVKVKARTSHMASVVLGGVLYFWTAS